MMLQIVSCSINSRYTCLISTALNKNLGNDISDLVAFF